MQIPQAEYERMSFRQKVLRNEFNAIQESDVVWITVRPAHETMWPSGQRFLRGHVYLIHDSDRIESDGSFRRVVQVKTDVGFWSFGHDGLSLAGLATLSVSRVHGQLLCLYEPEPEPILIKTAECGCSADGPCVLHATAANREKYPDRPLYYNGGYWDVEEPGR